MAPSQPVSGIPRGYKSPYKTAGKYHHRRELLFIPQWGLGKVKPVSRLPYPQGSTLIWQKHAPQAWPQTNNPETQDLYAYNECRYLLPALKARDNSVRSYILRQLDSRNLSGIGHFNVRWGSCDDNNTQRLFTSDNKLDPVVLENLPEEIPMHIIGAVGNTHIDILKKLLSHSISRQKIKALDSIVRRSRIAVALKRKTNRSLNPFPIVHDENIIVPALRVSHILTINKRYRVPDKRSPLWTRRLMEKRRHRAQYTLRLSQIANDRAKERIRLAHRIHFSQATDSAFHN